VGIAHLVVAWLVVQVTDDMIDNIGAPDWLFTSKKGSGTSIIKRQK